MAYITSANAKNIVRKIDATSLDLDGNIYKRPIYFFSKYEKNSLLAIQELLSNPKKFFTEIYIPIKVTDTYAYVYEGQKPAYHKSSECPLLRSDYRNFEIPESIKKRGKNEINKFRNWFKQHEYLLETPDIFAMRLNLRFGINTNPRVINYDNSGYSEINNYSLEQVKNKIDSMIKDAGRFYYRTEKNKAILGRFSKFTFLAYKLDPIKNNNTGYGDNEVKMFLKDYDNQFKKPLKALLFEYYRIKLNPDINLEGFLLEQLNFKQCAKCHR